jgi:NitT/TauT family transport system permease protein
MKLRYNLLSFLSIIIFILLWELASKTQVLPAVLPRPIDVAYSIYRLVDKIPMYTYHSISHFVAGFAIALVIGIPVGALSGWYYSVRAFVKPIVEIIRPIPPIAWIPFVLISFKSDFEASAIIIFIGSFFPIFTNTFLGFSNVPLEYVEIARTLGAGDLDILIKVALPSSLPYILSGIRTGVGVGWMCVVAAEMFGPPGLGLQIMNMRYLHDISAVTAYMLVIGVVGFTLERIVRVVEIKTLKWQKGFVRQV